MWVYTLISYNPKPQTMKNLLSNKTPQAPYGGDVMGGSVVLGILGTFLFAGLGSYILNYRPSS